MTTKKKLHSFRLDEPEEPMLEALYKRYNITEGISDYDKMPPLLKAVWEKTEEARSQDSNFSPSTISTTPEAQGSSEKNVLPLSSNPILELPFCPFLAYIKDLKIVKCSKDFNSRDPKVRGKIYTLDLQSCIQCNKRRQFMKQKSQQEMEKPEAEPDAPQTPLQKIHAEDPKSPTELCPKTKKWIKVADVCPDCEHMTHCPDFDRVLNDPELRRRIEWIMKTKK